MLLKKAVTSKEQKGLSMECSSMVSIAAFNLGDPGSNPGWFAVSNLNLNWVIKTQIIWAYDLAMPIAITATVSSLVVGDK